MPECCGAARTSLRAAKSPLPALLRGRRGRAVDGVCPAGDNNLHKLTMEGIFFEQG
jgi:hypothetical protein